jgi:hypothetical protein
MRLAKIATVVVLCVNLSGCFFIFIPGSLIRKVGDTLTGAEGDHCVSRSAKVGDQVRFPDGRTGTVQSLSGTSTYCSDTAIPIRAAVAF